MEIFETNNNNNNNNDRAQSIFRSSSNQWLLWLISISLTKIIFTVYKNIL